MFPYIVLSQKELYYILCVILLKNEFMRRLNSPTGGKLLYFNFEIKFPSNHWEQQNGQ
jgi:hypothetical protein